MRSQNHYISGRGDTKDLEVKSFQPLMDQLAELQRIDAEVNQLISISQSDKDLLNERIRQINLFLTYTVDLTCKIKELPVTYITVNYENVGNHS